MDSTLGHGPTTLTTTGSRRSRAAWSSADGARPDRRREGERVSGILDRARSAAVQLLLQAPTVVRGSTAERVATNSLRRLLDRDRSEVAVATWSDYLRSGNERAVHAAARSASLCSDPARLVALLDARAEERSGDARLQLDTAVVHRRLGDRERAAAVLRRITGSDVPATELVALVRELYRVADRESMLTVLATAAPADTEARQAVDAALQVAEMRATRTIGEIAREHAQDPEVLQALGVWAAGEPTSVDDLRVLGRVLLEAPPLDPETYRDAASLLWERGDFTLSKDLGTRALDAGLSSTRITRRIRDAREGLALTATGWELPEPGERSWTPEPNTVLYVLHSSLPHSTMGYATRTHGLLQAWRAQGWNVHPLTRPGFPEGATGAEATADVVDGITYERIDVGSEPFPHFPIKGRVAQFGKLLGERVERIRPGIIHAASNYRNGLAAIEAAHRYRLPSIYEVRGLWEYTRLAREPGYEASDHFALMQHLETEAALKADRVIVLTNGLKNVLVERGVPESSIVVAPNGVDTSRFVPQPRDTELAGRLGIGDRTVIGYVGSLLDYEGLDLLVEAAAELASRRDDFLVLIVGDGRSRPELEQLVAAHGLEDRIRLTGRVPHDEVERYYSLIDIAPFPRLPVAVTELVSPLKPLEAMGMGKAVVVSDVAALTEMVTDGETGLWFTKGSSQSLAQTLARLLDDDTLRSRLGSTARDWVRTERDWSVPARTIASIYEELGQRVQQN